MNRQRYLLASLKQHRRSHLPVALGVAVATAVVTGALLVGDSVRGSLLDLTLQRLGRIELAVVTQQPFRTALAEELAADPQFRQANANVDSAFQLRGSLTAGAGDDRRYAGGVSVLGISAAFDRHGSGVGAAGLGPGDAAITNPLANALGVAAGDEIVLRLPTVDAAPADSPLGEKIDTTVGKRLRVADVLKPQGLARFSLFPSQAQPRNLFLPIATVQQLVEQPGKANTLLIDGPASGGVAAWDLTALAAEALRPQLEDYGLSCEAIEAGDSKVVQIESNQLVLDDAVIGAAEQAFGKSNLQPVTTYLANSLRIDRGDESSGLSIPYSTITGVDSRGGVGPLLDEEGRALVLQDDEIVLNAWAAQRLGAKPGDMVIVRYYQPESTHGDLTEAPPLRLKLRAIVPLAGAAADPRLTPTLEGVTDAGSINDWDLPFELVEPIERADEDYWDDHTTTPKAFVSYALAKRLWATRWGTTSLLRVVGQEQDADRATAKLREAIDPADLGFAPVPVKQLGLAASSGTTPFEALFLGFSMFLIASAVMLIALLYGLGVAARAKELGLLSAVGWDDHQIGRSLTREGLVTAVAGVAAGIPAGIGYAWLMIWGLTTVWVQAIVTPFLSLHITGRALAIGAAVGLVVAWLTIRGVTRRVLRNPARGLLAGQTTSEQRRRRIGKGTAIAAATLTAAAVAALFSATRLSGEAQAGAFFGSGAMLLAALVLLLRWLLNRSHEDQTIPSAWRLWSLARRNVARNGGRSLLTVALVASASFLILAIGAFHLAPTSAGTGGFVLVGKSDQPIHFDLNTNTGRIELGFSRRDEALLDQFRVSAFRLHDGEDASCLNLYKTQQPRVLGVPGGFTSPQPFAFADSIADSAARDGDDAEWLTLQAESTDGIPIILDVATAKYGLGLGGLGSKLTIRDEAEREAELVVVGLLKGSVLQGDVLMSEANFLRIFPSASGSRFFLISPATVDQGDAAELAGMLESRLSDYGMDVEDAGRRLAGFLAVQNTYLSTFQTIGALGLLLGVVGVAVVQLRNIAERRGELALLQAAGFRPTRVRGLVLRENLLLLGAGLGIGAVAAAVAVLPQSADRSAATANLPWLSGAVLLGALLAIGVVVGGLATRSALRAPIIPALRGE